MGHFHRSHETGIWTAKSREIDWDEVGRSSNYQNTFLKYCIQKQASPQMIVDNIRKTIRATQSAVKRFGMSRVLFLFLLIVLSISSLAGSVVTHSYHSLMAYMIASGCFSIIRREKIVFLGQFLFISHDMRIVIPRLICQKTSAMLAASIMRRLCFGRSKRLLSGSSFLPSSTLIACPNTFPKYIAPDLKRKLLDIHKYLAE